MPTINLPVWLLKVMYSIMVDIKANTICKTIQVILFNLDHTTFANLIQVLLNIFYLSQEILSILEHANYILPLPVKNKNKNRTKQNIFPLPTEH